MEVQVKQLSEKEKEELGLDSWGVWEKEESEFDWDYSLEERCYILSGRATISYGDKSIEIKAGDYVIFPKGLTCTWKIHEPIKKRYNFYS